MLQDVKIAQDATIVQQGNLLELSSGTKQALRNIFMFLLSDRILVATPLTQR